MSRTDQESAPGRMPLIEPRLSGDAAGDSADDSNLRIVLQRLIQAAATADVRAVHVDVDQTPELAGFVEEEVVDG